MVTSEDDTSDRNLDRIHGVKTLPTYGNNASIGDQQDEDWLDKHI